MNHPTNENRHVSHLLSQFACHPHMQPQDAVKLCYQGAYGCEHLITDRAHAREWLFEEMATAVPTGRLTEPISSRFCRVNLGDWRELGLKPEWLLTLFFRSAAWSAAYPRETADTEFAALLCEARREGIRIGAFSEEQWDSFRSRYHGDAVRHTPSYRAAYQPAYRVLDNRCLIALPILQRILCFRKSVDASAVHDETDVIAPVPLVLAIDGRCGSGKSTIADLLAEVFGASVIHMDDFFLPPDRRTAARLSEPGGNVDYERFAEQVLPHLREESGFTYSAFDCHRCDYSRKRVISPLSESHGIRIVEGSYSHHPYFGAYADLRIFLTCNPEEQRERIRHRNGEAAEKVFFDRFIPMEEAYFAHFGIPQAAHLRLTTDPVDCD